MTDTGVKESNRCLKDLDVSSKIQNVLIKQGSKLFDL